MKKRVWVDLTVAEVDAQINRQAWQDYTAAERASIEKLRRWVESQGKPSHQLGEVLRQLVEKGIDLPDSLKNPMVNPLQSLIKQTVPQDLKIYGYTPAGEMVTCILPVDGSSFAEPVRADRTFAVLIPHKKVATGEEGRFSYIVNITDRQNRLLASTQWEIPPPQWVDTSRYRKREERIEVEQQALVGQRAPDFTLERVDGKGTVTLQTLRGRVVVLNVWATWCRPCVKELPIIEKLYPELQKKEIELLTIDVWESLERVQSFLHQKGYTFPVLRDASETMIDLYKIRGVPTTIIIDRIGVIRFFKAGSMGEEEFWIALRKGGAE